MGKGGAAAPASEAMGSCTKGSPSTWAAPAVAHLGQAACALGAPPQYRSPVRRMTARVKIPFAEPEQLGPDYVERLQQLSAQRGLCLTAVYVRQGCIELLIDEERWPRGADAAAAGAAAGGGVGARLRQLLAASSASGSTGAVPSGAPLPPLDLDTLLAALQLQPPPPPLAQDAASTAQIDAPSWLPHLQSVPLGSPVAGPDGHEPVRILSALPRVLPLPATAAARISVVVERLMDREDGPEGALEVLVRCGGTYLPCMVTPQGPVPDGRPTEWAYDVELTELPREPGAVLMEFRWGGRLGRSVPLLALEAGAGGADEGLAAELASVASSWAGPREELDDLLLDLGRLLSTAAAAATAAAMPGGQQGRGLAPSQASLAAHVLQYAREAGLVATAGRLQELLGAVAPAPLPGDGGGRGGVVAAGSRRRSLLLTSAALALGWEKAPADAEAAYEAYSQPIVLAQGHAIMAIEVLSLLVLLFRARHDLFSPANLTSLAGCAVGTATALAWPLLPYRHWVAMVNKAKIPRYLAYMTAKLMIGVFGIPAPPGIVAYQLGPAMLVMEGLLLPGSCLLSVRDTLLITLAKWPLGVCMMLESGATGSPLLAVALCGRVVVAALATTLVCHTYLRYSYARWAAAGRAARAIVKEKQH
ncbi:hypothetical protein GPECTOR_32g407 [Gonium pectorale]|uniref:Uncharacterized protein n=1 Tax=Gonium pectorale TaxID=33097 RepID=A0A150GDY5_GONPE|nr:hypothetical protein GPECTOR_32g407 [Gonium pectorale]|eukprot:KXZ47795.1 hypothetical protein GPECTOR_32g407 [Gonium pectorale]